MTFSIAPFDLILVDKLFPRLEENVHKCGQRSIELKKLNFAYKERICFYRIGYAIISCLKDFLPWLIWLVEFFLQLHHCFSDLVTGLKD